MSATSPNMQGPSVRRRIRDAICTLFCRPTRPPSPLQDTHDSPLGPELRPNPASESTPPVVLVEGGPGPVPESSAQKHPGEPSAEGSSAESLSSPKPLEDAAAISALEGTDTAVEPTSTPSTPTHEGPVAELPVSNPPTPRPCSNPPMHDLAPADDDVQVHTEPSRPLGSSPDDVHSHLAFETVQERPANPSSAASSIQSPAAPATPVAPDVEDSDSEMSVTEQESSLRNRETETQGPSLPTSVVVTLNVTSDDSTPPLHLTALCLLGIGGSQEGECIPLDENSPQAWTPNEFIMVPLGADEVYCIVKDEEGGDFGFVYLKQEDLQTSEKGARPFVTHDSQLSLSMSWEIAQHGTQSPGVDLSHVAWGVNMAIGDLLDNQQIGPATLDRLFQGSIVQQENLEIGTLEDYASEGSRLAGRFESTGHLDDINRSVVAFQSAVNITPEGHAALPALLNNLGTSFTRRFERTGDMTDIAQAIAAQQRAVQLTPEGHAHLPARLNNLGTSFQSCFQRTGDMTDIAQAIATQQRAVQLTPQGHAHLPARLNNLGTSFQSRFQRTGDMTNIAQAITAQQRAVQLTPQGHADLPARLNNLGNSFICRFQHTGDMTDIAQAIATQQRAVQLTPEGHAHLPARLNNLGTSFLRRFERTGDMTDIAQGIAAQQRAVQLTPQGHADLPAMLNNLGTSFQSRFECTGDMSDIAQAIAAQQRAVQLTPEGHARLLGMLNNLGTSFQSCFQCTGNMTDIAQAIATQQRAVQLTPQGHADLPAMLNNLGTSFKSRFQCTGDMTDIAQAIATQQRAVQLTPEGHADLPAMLNNLGTSFQSRFECTGDMTDIAQAIATQQRAVQLTPQGHADLPARLNNLGTSFQSCFQRTGDMTDIAQAIAAQQRAVQLTPQGHADLPAMLNNLGTSFQSRFECTGYMTDIAQAIATQQRAVQLTPEGHADLPARLNNLGTSFKSRFQRTGDMTDIAQAIAAQQRAVQLTPQGHADLPALLTNLGTSFQSRFERTGDMSDIVQAIAAQQKAVQLTPEGHADLPARLNNLGTSFQSRFQCTGDMSDIVQAIATQQRAVQLTPQGHAHLPARLNNLGTSFQSRFERTGDMSDIAQAIAAQQRAVQLTPQGHARLLGMLTNLGTSFVRRFERTGDMSNIAQAIATQQRAVQLTPEGHADLPALLNNLGTSFQGRFQCTGDMTDIAQAIATQQRAVQLTPQGHADLPGWLNNLGSSFQHRFEHAKSNGIGEQECLQDMHASVKCFRATTENSAGAPTRHLQGAISWARLINRHNPESPDALVPFETSVRLLTLVAGLERTLEGRYHQLQRVTGIALEAASAACRLGYPEKAVEWLEQGRCLVWGQLNGLRTPMEDLQERAPQLAQRLTDVAKQLEIAGSSRTAIDPLMELSAKISLEEEARSHSALAREWEELLLTARSIPDFESFLLPSPCSTLLQNLPESGPIIVINSHQDRCDALALLHGSDQPLHIPLPDFSLKKADHYRHVLKAELHSNGIRMREEIGSMDKKLGGTQERDITQDWPDETAVCDGGEAAVNGVLQSLWLEVAKPILDMLAYSRHDTSSTLPRIWWCPTGVMSFLPIHAAGIYGGANPECLMDYAISSYTPTITAITDRVKSSHSIDMTASGLLLTSQPKAPFAAEIAGTAREVNEVYAKAMENGMRALKREGDEISVEDCCRYMGEFSCVHLACHASQNASDPLKSRFLLHKGQLSLLSIIQMNLKNADLAFLSACQTSTGEEKLSDEAVHLAAGMLAAGYRRVVATMWSINDGYAPRVATDFYDYLWSNRVDVTGGCFDGSLSAHALHHAVQQLRRRLGNSERDLLTWIPYVHFGY